ncbi:MAG: 7-cyano-7-deazaguanine synthase [Phycisphaerae bacterium]
MPKAIALILSSGGLHSLVAAALASREYRIALLHLRDARAPEAQAANAFDKQVAHFKPFRSWAIDAQHLRQMSWPPETAGVVHSTGSDPYSNLIPLRDLQLLTIGAGFARQIHASVLIWGAQLDQKQADALARNIELVQIFNQLLDLYSTETPLTLKTPLMGLEDQQVIELGYQMAAPFAASWSCQMNLEFPCMSCPACARRLRAFRAAQLADPLLQKPKQSVVS